MFHPHALQPGEVFAGDFRIERPLAMGGMGAVYVAEQLSTGRKRALKLLLPSLVENLKTRERFEQEARIASRINSDHVVEVVGAGVDAASGAPWLAMELLEGETLTQRVERAGPLRPAEAIEVFKQLCHALGAAHGNGLVHRDIKPDNVYLAAPRREGIPFTLKILDFGIAKLTEDVRSTGSATGAIGSPLWMAPEQTDSSGVGPPADVWALGLVAFYCLTGRSYWRSASGPSATLQGLLREVMFDPIDPASVRAAELGVGPLLPAGFDAWFAHTVVREPAHRYQDATQALAALHPVLNPLSPTLALDAFGGAAAQTLPSNAPSIPAAFSATAPTAVERAALVSPPQASGSNAVKWVVGGLALLLVGGIAVAGVAGIAFGFYFTADSSEADTAATPAAPTNPPQSDTTEATGTDSEPTATADNAPTAKRSGAQTSPLPTAIPTQASGSPAAPAATPTAPAAPTATATAAPTAVAMDKVSDYPARDYKLSWYKQKITECWKGNEGAKPDAGSYSCTITVKLTELGQATSIGVSPRPYKYFAGCAVVRSGEHPWGKGPPESKSFSFNF